MFLLLLNIRILELQNNSRVARVLRTALMDVALRPLMRKLNLSKVLIRVNGICDEHTELRNKMRRVTSHPLYTLALFRLALTALETLYFAECCLTF